MTLEFDPAEDPRDYTKWVWLGVLVFFLAIVGTMWVLSRNRGDSTEVHAEHILIKFDKNDPADRARALELISDLRNRILKGERFTKLAKEFSNDETSSPRGGDLGYQRRGVFEASFEQFVWTAPLNQVSDVIETQFGFHLVLVIDRNISKEERYEAELDKKAQEKPRAAPHAP